MLADKKTAESFKGHVAEGQAKETYKKFVWDELLQYMALVSGVLVLIGLGSEYFLDRGLACTVSTSMSRDEARFAVMWCSSNMQVRLVDGIPFVIFVQGLFLAGPHLLWETMAASALEQFFAMVPSLSRLRDRQTGQYPFETVEIVRKLRATYGETSQTGARYFSRYRLKLWVQLIASLIFLAVLGSLFYYTDFFAIHFICTEVGEDSATFRRAGYLNSSTLTGYNPYDTICTYTTAASMSVIWGADVLVLIITTVAAISGVAWCMRPHYWAKLDYKSYASFLYSFSMNDTGAARQCFKPHSRHKKAVKIRTDLDFLVMMLFTKDNGQGETFFDVQVELELEELFRFHFEGFATYFSQLIGPPGPQDSERRLDHIKNAVDTATERLENFSTKLDFGEDKRCVLGAKLLRLCYDKKQNTETNFPMYKSGLHLFCGSKGCTLSLLQICVEMTAVDFNTFYNPKLVRRKKPEKAETKENDSDSEQPDAAEALETRSTTSDKSLIDFTPWDKFDTVIEENYRNLNFLRVSENITGREGPQLSPLTRRLRRKGGRKKDKYDLMVITCLEPHFQPSTASVILENIFVRHAENGCFILLVVETRKAQTTKNALESLWKFLSCESEEVVFDLPKQETTKTNSEEPKQESTTGNIEEITPNPSEQKSESDQETAISLTSKRESSATSTSPDSDLPVLSQCSLSCANATMEITMFAYKYVQKDPPPRSDQNLPNSEKTQNSEASPKISKESGTSSLEKSTREQGETASSTSV